MLAASRFSTRPRLAFKGLLGLCALLGCASEALEPAPGMAGAASGGTDAGAGAASGGSAPAAGGAVSAEGQRLYGLSCARCHGEQGRGSLTGPDIQHPIFDYSTWVVRHGRADTRYPQPMAAWSEGDLSGTELLLILDYLDSSPQPTTGRGLFLDYCANCHGADARGGVVNQDLTSALDELETSARSGHQLDQFELREEYMPAFSPARLSDADLRLIREHVESL